VYAIDSEDKIAMKKPIVCAWCGAEFTKKHSLGRPRKYCSDQCRRKADNPKARIERRQIKRQCPGCLLCFETERLEQKYCSNVCFLKRNRLKKKRCVICGKVFKPKYSNQRCCSTVCAKTKEGRTKRIYSKNTALRMRRQKERLRATTDVRYRLNRRMRSAVYTALKGKKNYRKWQGLVGYTTEDLKAHIEKRFLPGMSWANYGKWHIDHVVPISAFNFTSPTHEDFKKCWALENLQPLWAADNIAKNNRLEKPFQPSLAI